jgi:putative transcriptional regulator
VSILVWMSVIAPRYLAGRLLVAMPGIEDCRFHRAVIFLCAHDARHAMGLVVNRPADNLTVPRLLKQLGIDPGSAGDGAVLVGGPVQPERGFVLHSDDAGVSPSSETVPGGFTLTATREILEGLAGRQPCPRQALLAIGYSGWDGGQLEREIRNNVWLICEPDAALVFGDDHDGKWVRALAKLGVSPERLSAQLGQA